MGNNITNCNCSGPLMTSVPECSPRYNEKRIALVPTNTLAARNLEKNLISGNIKKVEDQIKRGSVIVARP